MSSFALRSRSTCVRLVFSSVAILFFEIFFFFMASASCQATTSLTACACASSKIPSCLRKSSILEPICFLLLTLTPSGQLLLTFELALDPHVQRDLLGFGVVGTCTFSTILYY